MSPREFPDHDAAWDRCDEGGKELFRAECRAAITAATIIIERRKVRAMAQEFEEIAKFTYTTADIRNWLRKHEGYQ
jgi:hypothetical protein